MMALRIILFLIGMLWSGPVLADDGTMSKEQLTNLFQAGKISEGVEFVMANLEQCDAITLFATASAGLRNQQLKQAALLYHAGKIRAKIDLEHYTSVQKGGDRPAQAMAALIRVVSQQLNGHPSFSMPTAYQVMAVGLTNWEPHYTSSYDPGWPYDQPPNFQEVQEDFDQFKSQRVRHFQGLAKLLSNEEYAAAFSIVKTYNIDVFLDQQAPEKLQAEETLKRIETELGISGFMASIEKKRKQLASTKCIKYLESGETTEC